MSRRTSDASKAISEAWKKEKERVLEGKGTRDWTPEQQQAIIEMGKAYDEYGKAFHGQHMKSVEKYPEFQGYADNIQFLTQQEHLAAHRGKWTNPTNWYFDPVTREFTDFGEGLYIPCTVINLSEPVVKIKIDVDKAEIKRPEKTVQTGSTSSSKDIKQTSPPNIEATKHKSTEEKTGFKGLWNKAVSGVKKAVRFAAKHKGKIVGGIAVFGIVAEVVDKVVNSSSVSKPTDSQNDNTYPSDDFGGSYSEKTDEDSFDVEERDDIENETTEKPYTPNDVPAGGQHYHYKDGSVKWKEKAPYSRGKKKNDDE